MFSTCTSASSLVKLSIIYLMVLLSVDYMWKMHAKCLPYFWYPKDTAYILASTIIFLGRKLCLFENFGNLFLYKGGGFTSSRETIGRDIVGKLFKPLTLFDSFCQGWRMRGEIKHKQKSESGFLSQGRAQVYNNLKVNIVFVPLFSL